MILNKLKQRFNMKDLDALSKFFGIEAVSKDNGLVLTEQEYATTLLHHVGTPDSLTVIPLLLQRY